METTNINSAEEDALLLSPPSTPIPKPSGDDQPKAGQAFLEAATSDNFAEADSTVRAKPTVSDQQIDHLTEAVQKLGATESVRAQPPAEITAPAREHSFAAELVKTGKAKVQPRKSADNAPDSLVIDLTKESSATGAKPKRVSSSASGVTTSARSAKTPSSRTVKATVSDPRAGARQPTRPAKVTPPPRLSSNPAAIGTVASSSVQRRLDAYRIPKRGAKPKLSDVEADYINRLWNSLVVYESRQLLRHVRHKRDRSAEHGQVAVTVSGVRRRITFTPPPLSPTEPATKRRSVLTTSPAAPASGPLAQVRVSAPRPKPPAQRSQRARPTARTQTAQPKLTAGAAPTLSAARRSLQSSPAPPEQLNDAHFELFKQQTAGKSRAYKRRVRAALLLSQKLQPSNQ